MGINREDNSGFTVLMQSASRGMVDKVELLIRYDADVNAKTSFGETALILAANSDHDKVCAALLEAGADIHRKTKYGKTALSIAVENNCSYIVKMIIDADSDGRLLKESMIKLAEWNGSHNIAALLRSRSRSAATLRPSLDMQYISG